MNLYRILYEGEPRREAGPSGPPPTGLRLLWATLRREWWRLIKANILFWLCCLPLVTIPAALKALSRVCITLLRGEPCDLGPDWWTAFRDGFLRTTGAGALAALALFAVGSGVRFYGMAMAENGLLAVPALLLLILELVLALSLTPLFLLLEFSELGLRDALRSAVLLTLVRLPQSLAILLILGVMATGYVLAYPYSSFVLGAIGLSLFWLIACFAAWPGLEKYVFHTSESVRRGADHRISGPSWVRHLP